ncbi:Vacuolar protein [Trichinella spiralis]|uniref:Vacuolar protein n=1 Tax=Trichinella spiralis TaxID=6334 RepID=A0ABR3K9X7_TRISP
MLFAFSTSGQANALCEPFATEAWRATARLSQTGKLPLRIVDLVLLLSDAFPGFQLRPVLKMLQWDSAINPICSRIKRWNAAKSDCNFSSAFTSLSYLSLVASASFSLPAMTYNSASENSAVRGSFPISVRVSMWQSMWSGSLPIVHSPVVILSRSSVNFLTAVYGRSKRSFSLCTATL